MLQRNLLTQSSLLNVLFADKQWHVLKEWSFAPDNNIRNYYWERWDCPPGGVVTSVLSLRNAEGAKCDGVVVSAWVHPCGFLLCSLFLFLMPVNPSVHITTSNTATTFVRLSDGSCTGAGGAAGHP